MSTSKVFLTLEQAKAILKKAPSELTEAERRLLSRAIKMVGNTLLISE